MIWFVLILFLLQLILYPVLLYRLNKDYQKKDKPNLKKRLIQFAVLGIFSGFFFNILPGSSYFWWPMNRIEEGFANEEITGEWFIPRGVIFEVNSPRSFNGDGYSLKITELSEEMVEYFEDPNPSFFIKYPLKSNRPDWQTKHWISTPIKTMNLDAYNFADYSLDNLAFELSDLLEEEGNYFSYQYKLHSFGEEETFGDIDFYIISPKRGIFVKINHNT